MLSIKFGRSIENGMPIAGCERVRDHVASLRRQLRLREELEILRRDNDRLKRPADAPAVDAPSSPISTRLRKRRKVSSPTVIAPVTATSCRPRPAMREKVIKWKLSGCTVAITPLTVPQPSIPSG